MTLQRFKSLLVIVGGMCIQYHYHDMWIGLGVTLIGIALIPPDNK